MSNRRNLAKWMFAGRFIIIHLAISSLRGSGEWANPETYVIIANARLLEQSWSRDAIFWRCSGKDVGEKVPQLILSRRDGLPFTAKILEGITHNHNTEIG